MDVLCRGGFSNPDWRRLGSMLGLSSAQLDSIAADKKADNTAGLSNALIDMLSTWLKRDLKSSWGKLADALKNIDEGVLAEKMRIRQGAACISLLARIPCITTVLVLAGGEFWIDTTSIVVEIVVRLDVLTTIEERFHPKFHHPCHH